MRCDAQILYPIAAFSGVLIAAKTHQVQGLETTRLAEASEALVMSELAIYRESKRAPVEMTVSQDVTFLRW
jgi:hypothetical protein